MTVLHRTRLLSERLLAWGAAPYRSKTLRRLSARILKHHHQLLTFLRIPGLSADNNQAERLIRPHVNDRSLGIAGFLFDDAGLGAAAIDLVAEQLNHNERGLPENVKRVLLPGRWFEGRSLRPAATSK